MTEEKKEQNIDMTPSEIAEAYGRNDPIVQLTQKVGENREIVTILMRKSTLEMYEGLDKGNDDALTEIERAHRLESSGLGVRIADPNRVRGGGTGESMTNYAIDLLHAYRSWGVYLDRNSPQAKSVALWVADGNSLNAYGIDSFVSYSTKKKLLNLACSAWQDIRGWTKTTPRIPPTARQNDVLSYIHHYISLHGKSPTVREIQSGCGIASTSGAQYLIEGLERRGLIVRAKYLSRSISLT